MSLSLKSFIFTLLLALLFSLFLPWWAVMVAAFVASLMIGLKKSAVFFIPFLAIALFWMGYALYLGSSNDFTLAKKIAVLFPLNGSTTLLVLITGIIGGIAAGVSSILGNQCRIFLKK